MDIKEVTNRIESVIAPVIESLGYSVVDCEYTKDLGQWVLRVFIEKLNEPITVDDCSKVSQAIDSVLDVEDVVPTRYSLEVSSPGLARPLKKPADFERFKGQMIRLKTVAPINGRGNYYGTLLGMKENDILMNVDGTEYKVPIDKLAKAKLDFKLK